MRKLKTKAAALPGSAAEEVGYLLDAHLAMLSNSRLVRGVDQRIARPRINAERAVQIEIDEIAKSFAAMRDPYLAARIDDIRVVGTRLIRNLIKKPYVAYSGLTGGAIMLAEEVTPADTALMDPRRDRRLRHRIRRRRKPHRDHGAGARPAGGARRSRAARSGARRRRRW